MDDWVQKYKEKASLHKIISFFIFGANLIGLIISVYNWNTDFDTRNYNMPKTIHIVFAVIFCILMISTFIVFIAICICVGVKEKKVKTHTIIVYSGPIKTYLIIDNVLRDTCSPFGRGHLSADLSGGDKVKVTIIGSGMNSINIDYIEPPSIPNMFF